MYFRFIEGVILLYRFPLINFSPYFFNFIILYYRYKIKIKEDINPKDEEKEKSEKKDKINEIERNEIKRNKQLINEKANNEKKNFCLYCNLMKIFDV